MSVPDPAREFEQRYAARSGMTVERLHFYGMFVEPCSCDYEHCEGWAMGHQHDDALFEEEMRAR